MCLNIKKVAGTVILYNAQDEKFINITSYIDQVDKLIVINNSDLNSIRIPDYDTWNTKIKLIDNHQNLGIAKALNQAANYAIEQGYEFLLTMDQDSIFITNYVSKALDQFNNNSEIAITCPQISYDINPKIEEFETREVMIALTSGSIIRLSVFKLLGGFDEKLFIDYVDYDFSLKVLSNGYKIFQMGNCILKHNLGNTTKVRLFFKSFYPTNHNPLRLYYRTRNRLYIRKRFFQKFPDIFQKDKIDFLKEIGKILLFEKEKYKKFIMIIRGYRDFKKNIYGKYLDI